MIKKDVLGYVISTDDKKSATRYIYMLEGGSKHSVCAMFQNNAQDNLEALII